MVTHHSSHILKGKEGRVLNIFQKETMATQKELLEYRKSIEWHQRKSTSTNDEIDDECCWGVAYQIHKYIWEQEVKERLEHEFRGGYEQKKMTFYPRV